MLFLWYFRFMEITSSESQSGCNLPIKHGMKFESDEHVYDYYNEYAATIDLSVRTEYTDKHKVQAYVTSKKITCYHEGIRDKDKRDPKIQKHRKKTRMGYLVHITVSYQSNGKFHITSLEEKHNHPCVHSFFTHILPSQRKIKVAHLNMLLVKLELVKLEGSVLGYTERFQ